MDELPPGFYEEGFDATRHVMATLDFISQENISKYRTRKFLELAAVRTKCQ